MRDIEQRLFDEVSAAQSTVNPNQAIDVTSIVAIITAIMEAIRGCRNPESAKAHIKRGSLIATIAARRAIVQSGYKGNALELARAVVDRGAKMDQAEVDAIVDETQDIPTTPPPTMSGGWPIWMLFLSVVSIFCFGSNAEANWPVCDGDAISIAETSWPTSVVSIAATKPTLPSVQAEIDTFSLDDLPMPGNVWELNVGRGYGNHSKEELINHLLGSNHNFERIWLEGLSMGELKTLHSQDHEGFVSNTLKRTATPGKQKPAKTAQTNSVASTSSQSTGGRWTTVRTGLFGRRSERRWVPAGSASYSRANYSGCPGGTCPAR